ncbi:hypothetical protein [Burkholderia ubonensis]|uniref:hypothetical protein n=1 Tax=Burkholderia ubonensis TaxID=101571 RepID=UPI00016A445C|nr:hypothetical protein [Burkholderia ubonensis]
MTIVLVLVVLAIGVLFGFAAHVDALTGRIGRQPAQAQFERLRREVVSLRAALRRCGARGKRFAGRTRAPVARGSVCRGSERVDTRRRHRTTPARIVITYDVNALAG